LTQDLSSGIQLRTKREQDSPEVPGNPRQNLMEKTRLAALRRAIAAIEERPASFVGDAASWSGRMPFPVHSRDSGKPEATISSRATSVPTLSRGRTENKERLAFGVPGLDSCLGGGLPIAALHEIRCAETRESGALTGFAVALSTRLAALETRPILWIEEEMGLAEAGLPFGGGLSQFGLDPNRLIVIRARRAEDVLWTFEEGLRCNGLAAVLAVIRASPQHLDLTTSRRLALRAARHRVMGLLLRQAGAAEPGAAMTRWRITPRPAATMDGFAEGIGRPAWRAELEKNRLGPTGLFDLEWDHAGKCFNGLVSADHGSRPAVSFHRPDRPADPRPGLAFKEAG
jgi:protein ImuA